MCSLHFKDDNYQIDRKDTNKARKNSKTSQFSAKILLPDAVPTIFPNLPKYLTKDVPEKRSETTSKESRFQRQYDAMELEAEEFLSADLVASRDELEEKLELPLNTFRSKGENRLTLYCLSENDAGCPIVKYSLIIMENLQFSMWCHEVKISPSCVNHICKDNVINSCSSVLNILAVLKNMSEKETAPATSTL